MMSRSLTAVPLGRVLFPLMVHLDDLCVIVAADEPGSPIDKGEEEVDAYAHVRGDHGQCSRYCLHFRHDLRGDARSAYDDGLAFLRGEAKMEERGVGVGEVDDDVPIVDDVGEVVFQQEGRPGDARDIDRGAGKGMSRNFQHMGNDEGGIGGGKLKNGAPHPAAGTRDDHFIMRPPVAIPLPF